MLFFVLLFIVAVPIVALSVFGHLLLHLFADYGRHRAQRHLASAPDVGGGTASGVTCNPWS